LRPIKDAGLSLNVFYFTAPARNQSPIEDFSEPEPKPDTKKSKPAGPAAKKVWHISVFLFCLLM